MRYILQLPKISSSYTDSGDTIFSSEPWSQSPFTMKESDRLEITIVKDTSQSKTTPKLFFLTRPTVAFYF